jgi:hypothetical protein
LRRRGAQKAIHPPGFLSRALEWLRGRRQRLVRSGNGAPLLLLSYPAGGESAAELIETAYSRTLGAMSPPVRRPYEELWPALPALVVVLLRPRNPCGCLGHHHPPGTESRLARRLAADLGHPVAEIDLAYQAIAEWQPEPLASLGVGASPSELRPLHLEAALLAVLLHEMEHLAFPQRGERQILARSREFYAQAMRELVSGELGRDYGMAWSRPP